MAGIHEIIAAAPQPKRCLQPNGEPRSVLRAYVAQFEQLVQEHHKLLERTELLLNSSRGSRSVP